MIGKIISWSIQTIRPLLGPPSICPFTVGCTQYAIEQFETQPIQKAIINVTRRILSCHPLSKKS